jgi:hypothetical protein
MTKHAVSDTSFPAAISYSKIQIEYGCIATAVALASTYTATSRFCSVFFLELPGARPAAKRADRAGRRHRSFETFA